MTYFKNCRTIEDVKETYRKLAKKLHPDCGGDAEEFKKMMAEYTVIFKRLKNVHRTEEKTEQAEQNRTEYQESPEDFADIINKVIFMDGVEIEIVGRWIWLSGNTYAYKDDIKAAGFFWSSKHKKWYWNGGTKKSKKHSKLTYEQVKDLHGCKTVKTARQARLTA